MVDNRNVLRNTSGYPMDCEHDGIHYTIGPYDRLVLPDLGNEDVLVSLMSSACSGSTVGSHLYPEDGMTVRGDSGETFAAGAVTDHAQDSSQQNNF